MGTNKLTAAEWSQLWTVYMNETALICLLKHFNKWCEDAEIIPIVSAALSISEGHIEKLTAIFNKENFPVPHGFKEDEDLNLDAPRLYSDYYVLELLYHLGMLQLNANSFSCALAVRTDVSQFFTSCLMEANQLHMMAKNVLLSKGLFTRSPHIPTPPTIEFVKKESFLSGYLGKRRVLSALEVTNLFANFKRNAIGSATMIGFSQSAETTDVRQFMVRGKKIAHKHCEVFGSILSEDDLPTPSNWDSEVTESTVPPFSDKMMMFMTTALIAISIGYYGMGVATSPRHDLGVMYSRLSSEIGQFANDGAVLMIRNKWLEKPPMVSDREELAKRGSHKS